MLINCRNGLIVNISNNPLERNTYILDFNKRVTKESVKNFQMIDQSDEDNVILQFGRRGEETYAMDFKYPLTPLQAFAISLSSIDRKLGCQ
jgi:tubby-related protein 1